MGMRREGKTVIVMGIGPQTDEKALECMAGGPEHSHKAKSFDELLKGSYVDEVKNELRICENTLLWRIQKYFEPKLARVQAFFGPAGEPAGASIPACKWLSSTWVTELI